MKTSDPTLEIKTDSMIGSNDVMDLRFYTTQQERAGGIKIFFKSTPLIHLHWCTSFPGINFATSLPPDIRKVWRITQISGSRVRIYCNEVEVLDWGGGLMTTFGDFWGLMGTKNHGDSG